MLQRYPIRITGTIIIFGIFVFLALGSDDTDRTSSYSPPDPVAEGEQKAWSWGKAASPDIAAAVSNLEVEKQRLQQEVWRLSRLADEFPDQRPKIESEGSKWENCARRIDASLEDLQRRLKNAYIQHQIEGKDESVVLLEVYSAWKETADSALDEARQLKSSGSPP